MYRMIMVDDEPWALLGIQNIIDWKRLGFEIIYTTQSSVDALEKILQLRPDVVLTDIRMPRLSGLQLIHECRKAKVKSEFLVVSGFEDFAYAREAMNLGVFRYLLKPLDHVAIAGTAAQLALLLDNKQTMAKLHKKELLRSVITGEDTATTFSQLFAASENSYGMIALLESPLEDLHLRLFAPNVGLQMLRISRNRVIYAVSAPQKDMQVYDPAVRSAMAEMGVSFAASDWYGFDTPVWQAARQAEEALHQPGTPPEPQTAIAQNPQEEKVSSADMQRIIAYINENYAKELSLERISEQFHFSFSHICHMFRREIGMTFLDYLTGLRMNKAKELLAATEDPVTDIAARVGYNDYYYFCRVFKRRFQTTPTAYRKAGGSL